MEKEGQFLHIPEFGARFGLSRIEVFRKVKDGSIPHRRKGKFYLIPLSFVSKLNGDLTEGNSKGLDAFLSDFPSLITHNTHSNPDFSFKLSIAEIGYIAQKLDIEIHYNKAVLTNCLETPFIRGERREFFSGIFEKASVMLYLLVKNRPFGENQIKLNMMSLVWFLHKNGERVDLECKQFVETCDWIQKGDSRFYKQMIDAIEIFLIS